MDSPILLAQVENHVEHLFDSQNTSKLLYHNFLHTQKVVKYTTEIADHYQLSNHSNFILLSAAWFHDTGQLTGDMEMHEETSVSFMEDFFSGKNVATGITGPISQIILATKMSRTPISQLEKIIRDADTWHLGTTDFRQLDKMVWEEIQLRTHQKINDQLERSLAFLKAHQFYTDYCKQKLSEGKKKNIELLQAILN